MNKSEKKKQQIYNQKNILHHWTIFDKLYPDEAACLRAIVLAKSQDGLFCEKCNIKLEPCSYKPRAYQCKICKKKIWPTVGTFFEKAKKLKPRLAEIWFMEHQVKISDNKFADILDVSQSTTWDISHTLAEIMGTKIADHADLSHSSIFLELFGKRSLDTVRKEPANSEQEAFEQDQLKEDQQARDTYTTAGTSFSESNSQTGASSNTNVTDNPQPIFNQSTSSSEVTILQDTQDLTEEEEAVYNQLSEGPKSLDSICNELNLKANKAASLLSSLELEGLINSLPGNFYTHSQSHFTGRSSTVPLIDSLQTKIKIPEAFQHFANYIKTTFHSISRKHLQNYLALYWTHISNYWSDQKLLKYCLRYRGETPIMPVKFVTPLWVYVPRPSLTAIPPTS